MRSHHERHHHPQPRSRGQHPPASGPSGGWDANCLLCGSDIGIGAYVYPRRVDAESAVLRHIAFDGCEWAGPTLREAAQCLAARSAADDYRSVYAADYRRAATSSSCRDACRTAQRCESNRQ